MLTVLNALKFSFQNGQKLGWAHFSSKSRRPTDASHKASNTTQITQKMHGAIQKTTETQRVKPDS
jgi:hypothetical protein